MKYFRFPVFAAGIFILDPNFGFAFLNPLNGSKTVYGKIGSKLQISEITLFLPENILLNHLYLVSRIVSKSHILPSAGLSYDDIC